MPAAGIRPQPARVILLRIALLQQHASLVVDQEDREGAMQEALSMGCELGGNPHRTVLLIDQDQRLVGSLGRFHLFTAFAAIFAALALRRSMVLATSTTKRVCMPRLTLGVILLGSSAMLYPSRSRIVQADERG